MSYHAGRCKDALGIDTTGRTSRRLIGVEIENADSAGEIPTVAQHRAVAGLMLVGAAHYKWQGLEVVGHYGLAYNG